MLTNIAAVWKAWIIPSCEKTPGKEVTSHGHCPTTAVRGYLAELILSLLSDHHQASTSCLLSLSISFTWETSPFSTPEISPFFTPFASTTNVSSFDQKSIFVLRHHASNKQMFVHWMCATRPSPSSTAWVFKVI